jgi:FPC/CPF motif-containing protein YcgG
MHALHSELVYCHISHTPSQMLSHNREPRNVQTSTSMKCVFELTTFCRHRRRHRHRHAQHPPWKMLHFDQSSLYYDVRDSTDPGHGTNVYYTNAKSRKKSLQYTLKIFSHFVMFCDRQSDHNAIFQ